MQRNTAYKMKVFVFQIVCCISLMVAAKDLKVERRLQVTADDFYGNDAFYAADDNLYNESGYPSLDPTEAPTEQPTFSPSFAPTEDPTDVHTEAPSFWPSTVPSFVPTPVPFIEPTVAPSFETTASSSDSPYVTISSINVVPGKTYLQLTVSLSNEGTVYCGAYTTASGSTPSSVSDVVLQNFYAASNTSIPEHKAHVRVTNLAAITSYSVYCAARSTLGIMSSLANVLSTKVDAVTTTCCKSASVQLKNKVIPGGTSGKDFITVTLSSMPNDAVTLKISFIDTASNIAATAAAVSPSTVTITSSNTNRVKYFSLSTSILPLGDYQVMLTISGPSIADYDVVYTGTRSLVVYDPQTEPPTPNLVSSIFSDDGSKLSVNFDSATDRAAYYSNTFTCNELLNFTCANQATCQWSSDATILAILSSTATPIGGGGGGGGSGGSCVLPTDTLSLAKTALTTDRRVRAKCGLADGVCAYQKSWSTSSTLVAVVVAAPTNAVRPAVQLAVPDTIGPCTALSVDVSRSTGSGGRNWLSFSFTVYSSAILSSSNDTSFSQTSESGIEAFLNDPENDLFSPLVIPHTELSPNKLYSIDITLCNFLGTCGAVSKTITVVDYSIPSVDIASDFSSTFYRARGISIKSTASKQVCGHSPTSTGLLYEWSISLGGERDFSLITTSKDPSIFKLSPYSLQTGKTYTILLTVQVADTLASNSKQVFVTVVPGPVVAIVGGGSLQSVRTGDSLILDGSSSYDSDVQTFTGSDAGLNYTWALTQVAPFFNDTCDSDFIITYSDSGFGDTLLITAKETASIDTVCQVVMDIVGSTTNSAVLRTASATVEVSVLPLGAPVLSLAFADSSVAKNSKINEQDVLLLSAEVSLPAEYSGDLQWRVDSDSGYNITEHAETPISGPIINKFTRTITTSVYLSLRAFTVEPGTSMTFTLSFVSKDVTSVGAISVHVNSPPYGGGFTVYPINGTEIVDSFAYVASKWSDTEDLPIAYQFGYISLQNVNVVQVSRNLLTYGSSALPAGYSDDDYSITCRAEIFDSLGAYIIDTFQVHVLPAPESNMLEFFNATLDTYGASSDSIRQQTAMASSFLNRVTCDSAPSNCSALYNRKPCRNTVDTCGPCLSDAYIGDSGDRNSLCVYAGGYDDDDDDDTSFNYEEVCLLGNYTSTSAESYFTTQSCAETSDCTGGSSSCPWLRCVDSSCVLLPKNCQANCSGVGTCKFVNHHNGVERANCYNGDSTCDAMCECSEGYSGSSCAYTEEEIEERKLFRGMLLESVADLVSGEDADATSVTSWFDTLLECIYKPDELSFDVSTRAMSLTFDFLNSAIDINLAPNAASSALKILDSATQASSYEILNSEARRRRRLQQEEVESSAPVGITPDGERMRNHRRILTEEEIGNNVNDTIKTVNLYGSLASRSMQPGQKATQNVFERYRLSVEKVSTEELSQSVAEGDSFGFAHISMPQTALESDRLQSTVAVPASGGDVGSQMSVTALQLSATLYTGTGYEATDQVFNSDPLTVTSSPAPACASNESAIDCFIELTIRNADAVHIQLEPVEAEQVQCFKDDYFKYNYTCSSGEIINVACQGEPGFFYFNCTRTWEEAVCTSLGVNGPAVYDDCSLVSSTPYNITCACLLVPLPKEGFAPTEAPTFAPTAANKDGSMSVSVVSMLSSTADTFVETFKSTKDLTLRDIKASWTIVTTLGLMGLFGLGAVLLSNNFDQRDKKQLDEKIKKFGPACFSSHTRYVHDGQKNGGAVTNKRRRHVSLKANKPEEDEKDEGKEDNLSSAVTDDYTVKVRMESSLPNVLMTSKSYYMKIVSEFLSKHKWLNCAFLFEEGKPRALRIMVIYTELLVMLFTNTVVYSLTDPDDGSCELEKTESGCLKLKSDLNSAANKCRWTGDEGPYYDIHGFCEFITPDEDVLAIVYVAVIAAVITTIPQTIIMILINKILAVPVKTKEEIAAEEEEKIAKKRAMELQKEQGKEEKTKPEEAVDEIAKEEAERLLQDIQRHRSRMSAQRDRDAFDAIWGIDSVSGTFIKAPLPGKVGKIVIKVRGIILAEKTRELDRMTAYMNDLSALRKQEEDELFYFNHYKSDEFEIGKRLVFLFLCDMLPQMQSAMLMIQGSKAFTRPKRMPLAVKIITWTFMFLTFAGMLFYMMLFAISKGAEYQRAWLFSFLIFMIIDLFFVSTLTATFKDIILPSQIADDVAEVERNSLKFYRNELLKMKADPIYRRKVTQILSANVVGNKDGPTRDTIVEEGLQLVTPSQDRKSSFAGRIAAARGDAFNAAPYFFLSSRIAQHYPHVKESKLILLYSTCFPQPRYSTEAAKSDLDARTRLALTAGGGMNDDEDENSDSGSSKPPTTNRRKAVGYTQIFTLFFLFWLLLVPENSFDAVFEIICNIIMGWAMLAALTLYGIHPVLAFVVPIGIALILWLLIRERRKKESKTQKQSQDTTKRKPTKDAINSNVSDRKVVPIADSDEADADAATTSAAAADSAEGGNGEGLQASENINEDENGDNDINDDEDEDLVDFTSFFNDAYGDSMGSVLNDVLTNSAKKRQETKNRAQLALSNKNASQSVERLFTWTKEDKPATLLLSVAEPDLFSHSNILSSSLGTNIDHTHGDRSGGDVVGKSPSPTRINLPPLKNKPKFGDTGIISNRSNDRGLFSGNGKAPIGAASTIKRTVKYISPTRSSAYVYTPPVSTTSQCTTKKKENEDKCSDDSESKK